jgi:hypothetical protein
LPVRIFVLAGIAHHTFDAQLVHAFFDGESMTDVVNAFGLIRLR